MEFNFKEFNLVPHQRRVEKPWGHEIIYTPEKAPFTGKLLFIKSGFRLSLQYHDKKEECLMLFSGKAKIFLDDHNGQLKEISMEPHRGYHVKPGQKHTIQAVTDSHIMESSMPECGNTFRINDLYNRPHETEELRKLENRGWNPD